MLSAIMDGREPLAAEGRLIGRYLAGIDPPGELVARYAEASRELFPDGATSTDEACLDFVLRHDWSLGPLESALGLIRPDSLLRRKIVVMTAILETDPRFAERFDARCPGPARAILALAWLGLASSVKIVAGAALYAFVRARG